MIIFEQWDKLVRFFTNIAVAAAQNQNRYEFNRLIPVDGKVMLKDRAMNTLTLADMDVTLVLPDMVPGKARDFLLRATLENGGGSFRIEGADAYEGEVGALESPVEGETAVYLFSETSPNAFLVSRRSVVNLEI